MPFAANWKTAGGASILAIGDNLNIGRPYFPFLAGLIEVRANWGKLALLGSRSAFKVLDVLHGTGGIASNLFDMMSSTRGQKAERASRILSQLERDILSDLRRFCRSKQLLLIADNAHWWDMQTDVLGGLDARTEQKLKQITDALNGGRPYEPVVKQEVSAGAVLTREWRGVVHTAVITAKGVEYEGKIYRSLSDVARTITGTRWSGPRFFGLDQRPTKKQTSLSSGEIAA